tara:strand:- start:38 stop:196 length:159 start_codon:yes stop_codon:yes gene_type:complete
MSHPAFPRYHRHHSWIHVKKEPLVHSLLTLHNVKFMCDLCEETRGRILRDEI